MYDFYRYGVLAFFFTSLFSPDLNPNVAFYASLFVFWTRLSGAPSVRSFWPPW